MIQHRVFRIVQFAVFGIVAVIVFGFVFGYVTLHLWNWLLPGLFGWKQITFWQAVGLVILSKILFGGIRGPRGPHRHWRGRMRDRWEQMTPEEREKFREGMRRRCGHFEAPAAKPTVQA